MNKPQQSCWSCDYQQIGGNSFLGVCTFFSRVGKPNKEIPANVVDDGCKHWAPRVNGTGARERRDHA